MAKRSQLYSDLNLLGCCSLSNAERKGSLVAGGNRHCRIIRIPMSMDARRWMKPSERYNGRIFGNKLSKKIATML